MRIALRVVLSGVAFVIVAGGTSIALIAVLSRETEMEARQWWGLVAAAFLLGLASLVPSCALAIFLTLREARSARYRPWVDAVYVGVCAGLFLFLVFLYGGGGAAAPIMALIGCVLITLGYWFVSRIYPATHVPESTRSSY